VRVLPLFIPLFVSHFSFGLTTKREDRDNFDPLDHVGSIKVEYVLVMDVFNTSLAF